MADGFATAPAPRNEPVRGYAPGSPEREVIVAELDKMRGEVVEFGGVVGGNEMTTGDLADLVCPHDHAHVLARYHRCGAAETLKAIDAAKSAHPAWSNTPWESRAAVFLRAAELLATKYRATLNAATMLNLSKTVHQAEIDSACELIDFLRFNVAFLTRIYGEQPCSGPGVWNRVEYRPLEGFVFAVAPFNFTSIAANLPTSAALMGCTVVWKPSPNAALPAFYVMRLLEEAGLPKGVINLVTGRPAEIGEVALRHPDLGGIHFTGSTATFQYFWRAVGENIANYMSYPRIVGETGGKDFIFAHPTADLDALACAIIRGGYEYQGQKCSAASRVYVPASLWPDLKDRLVATIADIQMGCVCDFKNFMGAVIDRPAFTRITGYLDHARGRPEYEIIAGGGADDSKGYFVEPTLIEAKEPGAKLLREEIFGPVVTAYTYEDR
ncbi:aldehyde dehydrogenase family protein, partial [Planctomycetota bacterium]